jgi:hypothetical protein
VTIGLLGPLVLNDGGTLEPRDRIALAALAVRRGQVVTPDELADALWRGSPPPTWNKQVQICVGRLRKALGASAIETAPGGYRLALDGDNLDYRLRTRRPKPHAGRMEDLPQRARRLSRDVPPGWRIAVTRAVVLYAAWPILPSLVRLPHCGSDGGQALSDRSSHAYRSRLGTGCIGSVQARLLLPDDEHERPAAEDGTCLAGWRQATCCRSSTRAR